VEKEFLRISKNIKLLCEGLRDKFPKEILRQKMAPKDEIINYVVNSLETINKISDEKKKELLDSSRVKKISAQSEEEYKEIEQQITNELDEIETESEERGYDIAWEIIPKKGDDTNVTAEKVDLANQIFNKLTSNSKKFLLTICISLLGLNLASSLFSKNKDAKSILNNVSRSGFSIDKLKSQIKIPTTPIIKFGEIGAGGSIGEKPKKGTQVETEPETDESAVKTKELKKLSEKLKELGKKYTVKDPTTMKIGEKFDPSKTVFTNASFPYVVNYDATSAKYLNNENSVDIIGKYLKELDEFTVDKKTGLKLLALSMTVMEGYKKNTKKGPTDSYTTNNPGNIDNTDSGHRHFYKTLKDGIAEQIKYLESAAKGNNLYPIGKLKSQQPYLSGELGRYTPGFAFIYEGTLEQFVKIYATGPRIHNNYMNGILTFFKKYFPDANVTPKTKIAELLKLGANERLIDLIEKHNPGFKKLVAIQMVKGHYKSWFEVMSYTGLTAEELKELGLADLRKDARKKSSKF
jgi:hypothetical protein